MKNRWLDPLSSYLSHVECYVWHNFENMAKYCKFLWLFEPYSQNEQQCQSTLSKDRIECSRKGAFKDHLEEKNEYLGKFGISPCTLDDDNMSYIENQCPYHMWGDRRIFIFLKRIESGHVVFYGNDPTRVLRRGVV